MSSLFISYLVALFIALHAQVAQGANVTNSSAVFVFTNVNNDYQNSTAGTSEFVFGLNLVPNGDLYFHMSAPPGNAWMGVGIGSSMPGALMFMAYPSSNGSGMTISPRIAQHGHSEPTYTPSITCEPLFTLGLLSPNNITSTGYDGLDGGMYADAVCHNVSGWAGYDALNFNDTKQPFIFAVGDGVQLASDSPSAPLRRHSFYGHFTMDMTQAVVSADSAGAVLPNGPKGTYVAVATSSATDTQPDNDLAPTAHGIVMCIAFIIVFPTGALVKHFFKRIMFHAVVQSFGALCVVVGFGIAIDISLQYNRSRDFQSSHQVLGLLLLGGVLLQFGMGVLQHRIFKKTQKQGWWFKIHLVIGPAVMLLGVINGGLGLHLAGSSYMTKPYIVVVVMVALVFFTCRGSMFWCRRRRRNGKGDKASKMEAFQVPQYQAPYQPPAYGHSFPMQPYQGQHGVPQQVVYPKR